MAIIFMLAFALLGRFQREPFPGRPTGGRITGKVVLSDAVTSRKMRFQLYTDPGPGSAPKSPEPTDEMANVVIYLDSVPANPARPTDRVTMVQRDETFGPHVVAIRRGGSVEFKNDDPYFHNVFSLSSARTFDLGRFPKGQSKTVQFDRPGIIKVFCHIHADMSAAIVVLDSPYFTNPDPNGRFELNDVPPGDYRVVAWHDRARAVIGHVRVTPGETASIDFNIPVPHDVAGQD